VTAPEEHRSELIRQLAGILANVAVLTALLVYFGWVRAEVQSRQLGFDESLLGASTRDYLLRSVRPVLVLLIVVSLGGLVWVALDRWLIHRLRSRETEDPVTPDPVARWAIRALLASVVLLPLAVRLARPLWPATTYVAFPLSVAAGLLLALYALSVRAGQPGGEPLSAERGVLVRVCAGVLAGIGLFTAAANYATVEGTQLAFGFVHELPDRPSVVVYSGQDLQIDAPGAEEQRLPPEQSAYLFRYVGLRLLEHTEGTYFLVSDGWTPEYGVVVVLPEDASMRLEFVRDTRNP
jgi:hypothetical protein